MPRAFGAVAGGLGAGFQDRQESALKERRMALEEQRAKDYDEYRDALLKLQRAQEARNQTRFDEERKTWTSGTNAAIARNEAARIQSEHERELIPQRAQRERSEIETSLAQNDSTRQTLPSETQAKIAQSLEQKAQSEANQRLIPQEEALRGKIIGLKQAQVDMEQGLIPAETVQKEAAAVAKGLKDFISVAQISQDWSKVETAIGAQPKSLRPNWQDESIEWVDSGTSQNVKLSREQAKPFFEGVEKENATKDPDAIAIANRLSERIPDLPYERAYEMALLSKGKSPDQYGYELLQDFITKRNMNKEDAVAAVKNIVMAMELLKRELRSNGYGAQPKPENKNSGIDVLMPSHKVTNHGQAERGAGVATAAAPVKKDWRHYVR